MFDAKISLSAMAGISLLALAACSEDQSSPIQTPTPSADVEAQQPTPSEEDRADEALKRIGEGATTILEGAQDLARDAKKRTEKLLEDAGPTVDRATEIAREIGASLNEITRQGLRDFQTGVELLEKRIAESRSAPATGNPETALPARDKLRADTRAAAQAGPAGVGPGYVGVWAGDAASCAKVDQEPLATIAVITPTTIRRQESVCNFAETPVTDGRVTLQASCIEEGELEDFDISIAMADENTLSLDGGTPLIRCQLGD
jgi:hypothetical protein